MSTSGDNKWLIGIMGAVGATMIVLIVGFQAQIDQRQDAALRQLAEMNAEVHRRQDESIKSLADTQRQTTRDLSATIDHVAQVVSEMRSEMRRNGR